MILTYNGRELCRVIPDDIYPGMYRIAWPDGRRSDLGNLSRIRDAAQVLCGIGRNGKSLKWKASDAPSGRGYSDFERAA